MKLTNRERSMLLVLPLAAVLIGYAWWFAMSQRPKLAAAQRDLADAQAKAVSPAALMEQEARTSAAARELKNLEAEKLGLEAQIAALRRYPINPARRMESLRDVTTLFHRHHLQVIEEGTQHSGQGAKLPPALTDALGRLSASTAENAGGQLRTYKLAGRFVDLLQAVKELADDENPPGVPISLAMAEAEEATQTRTWTLVLWM